MKNDNEFKNLDSEFKQLVKDEKLSIEAIEDIMVDNIENYKSRLKIHIEKK